MSTYYEVLLSVRDGDSDRYVARIDPGDFPENGDFDYDRTVGAGGAFDVELLPAVVKAASRHFKKPVIAAWVNDSTDDLYFEPTVPYLVPRPYQASVLDDHRTLITLSGIA